MKMYKETLKRLSPIGFALAIATMIYTIITGGQDCFGAYTRSIPTSAIGMAPVLVYYVFTAVIFGMYGFSFLFRRSASDLYHSLPVTRTDLYLSTTLATATWMGGTILLNMLCMLAMQLIGGVPFVPVYIPMLTLYYFVAAMLVYAATTIGCALSGTFLTALATTGVVLFLPRFVQFIIARGVVAKTSIIGWLDLGALLNPMSNVATGLVVMQSRSVFVPFAVQMSYILYSLVPLALELALGAWLFLRRPSETADHGASRKLWPVATACLLAFAALLMITVDNKPVISMYGAAFIAIAFLIFVVYQVIAARNVRQIVMSLPCFLLSAALAFGVSLGMSQAANSMLNETPKPSEIASVTFRGHDYRNGTLEYTTLLLNQIAYTDDEMKKYVSDTLADAVDRVNDPENAAYDVYSQYQRIEPVTITLNNGQTILRTIEFKNIDTLNELRASSEFFQAAMRAFPQTSSMQYLYVDNRFTKAENQAIWDSYVAESQQLGLISNDYYREQTAPVTDNSNYSYYRGKDQMLNTMACVGYVADQRFSTYNNIRLETPKTVSLLMHTYNQYIKADTTTRLREAVKHMASPLALENDSVNLNMTFYNVPRATGDPAEVSVDLYISGYSKQSDTNAVMYSDFAERFSDILKRGTPTEDPSGMFLLLNWNDYDSSNPSGLPEPICYLSFSAADQQALAALVDEWQTDTLY